MSLRTAAFIALIAVLSGLAARSFPDLFQFVYDLLGPRTAGIEAIGPGILARLAQEMTALAVRASLTALVLRWAGVEHWLALTMVSFFALFTWHQLYDRYYSQGDAGWFLRIATHPSAQHLLAFCLFGAVLHASAGRPALRIGVAAGLSGVLFWAGRTLESRAGARETRRWEAAQVAAIRFPVYLPERPPGRLGNRRIQTSGWPVPDGVEISYEIRPDTWFTITEFPDKGSFRPPEDCGPPSTTHPAGGSKFPGTLVVTTRTGAKLYRHRWNHGLSEYIYLKVGKMMVVLEIPDERVTETFTKEELEELVDSLRETPEGEVGRLIYPSAE